MLFKIALLLLGFWLLGVSVNLGDAAHVLLLAGLLLLLIAVLKSRDAAAPRAQKDPEDKR